jgi:hypothetical protein
MYRDMHAPTWGGGGQRDRPIRFALFSHSDLCKLHKSDHPLTVWFQHGSWFEQLLQMRVNIPAGFVYSHVTLSHLESSNEKQKKKEKHNVRLYVMHGSRLSAW